MSGDGHNPNGSLRAGRTRWLLAAAAAAGASAPAHAAPPGGNLPGFPRDAGGAIGAAAVVADLDSNGAPEIVLAAGVRLQCFLPDGKSCAGFPVGLGPKVYGVGNPAVGDLDGDGRDEVVVALSDGRVVAVRAGGAVQTLATGAPTFAGPSVADLNGDGRREVLLGTKDGQLHAFKAAGGELAGFPAALSGAATSAASVARFGGKLAVAVGTEDGRLYALDASGQTLEGFPVLARFAISGQPAFGDVNDDGEVDLVAASQDFRLYALRANGTALPGFPVDLGYRLYGGPALVDLDVDGRLEIAVASGDGRVHVVTGQGKPVRGFPVKVGDRAPAALIAADLDRDGREDLALCTQEGHLVALKANGRSLSAFPSRLGAECTATPAAADLSADGSAALVVGTVAGKLHAVRVRRAGKATGALSWPQVGRDPARSGRRYPNPPRYADLSIAPAEPATHDALKASYRFFDVDGDPEPATRIRWWRNGQETAELAGRREVPKEATQKGEGWQFAVQASDDSPQFKSPKVTIRNSPPTAAQLALTPAVPRRGGPTRVEVKTPATDPDGDKLSYAFTWLRTGSGERRTGAEVPAGTMRRGERWTAVAIASDGEAQGPAASLEAAVANTAPGPPAVALEPSPARVGDVVRVRVATPAKDVDDDKLGYRYRWTVAGRPKNYPLAAGELPPRTVRKGEEAWVRVSAYDGDLESTSAEARLTIANTAPTVPAPAIWPARPRHGDALVAGLAAPATDADGDALAYRYTWFRNGKRQAFPLAQADVPASEVKKGDTWAVEIVAGDGEADSPPGRREVVVANTPPSPPAIGFASESPLAGEAVAVRTDAPAADPDGDAVTVEYAWEVDGKPLPLPKDLAAIPAGKTRKGQVWTVTATPKDGEAAGRSVSAQFVARNHPPGEVGVRLDPTVSTATTGVALRVLRPSVDRDGDPVKFRVTWYRNGRRIDPGADPHTLQGGSLRGGDQVRVAVVPFDGEDDGPLTEAQITVANTPPSAPEVAIEPAKPTVADGLTCTVRKPSDDPDGDPVALAVRWTVDGRLYPAPPDGLRVEPGALRHGQRWHCEVVARDAASASTRATAEVVVANTPPAAPTARIEPEAPTTGDPLVCRIAGEASDPDADPLTYTYRWMRDGTPYPPPREPSVVPPEATVRGQKWRCEVTAADAEGPGPAGGDERTIGNTPPSQTAVRVVPAAPGAGATLRCEIAQPATDPDGDSVEYRYQWLKNGVAQPFSPSSVEVPGRLVKDDDLWRCVVTPTDGQGDGPAAESTDVLIRSETARAQR